MTGRVEEAPTEGARIGRYVLLRDVDGHLHAIAATALRPRLRMQFRPGLGRSAWPHRRDVDQGAPCAAAGV